MVTTALRFHLFTNFVLIVKEILTFTTIPKACTFSLMADALLIFLLINDWLPDTPILLLIRLWGESIS